MIENAMRSLILILALFSPPFWEAKNPDQWTDQEARNLLDESPWAHHVGIQQPILVYLATARPVEEAQQELARRGQVKRKASSQENDGDFEYAEYLRQHRDSELVLAIAYPAPALMGEEREWRRFKEQTVLKIGKKTYNFVGYFPPTPSDPVLRVVFPRKVETGDKTVVFRLYLPGLNYPERDAEFNVKDLTYRGKLEM